MFGAVLVIASIFGVIPGLLFFGSYLVVSQLITIDP